MRLLDVLPRPAGDDRLDIGLRYEKSSTEFALRNAAIVVGSNYSDVIGSQDSRSSCAAFLRAVCGIVR